MTVWRPLTDENSGYLYSLSDSLRIVEANNPDLLVPVNSGCMILASDYSGQHKRASHEAYSFVVTTDLEIANWLPFLDSFRRNWLPDGRRISFKKLKEPVRWKALPAYLETAGKLRGNLISILVDRKIISLCPGGPNEIREIFPDCFPAHARHGTIEKMFRLASFMALIVSGMRLESQQSRWISDHDETLDTHEKREQFARLAAYLMFGLTKWREPADQFFGTTEAHDVPYWSEDVAAIADLAAGAYCRMSDVLPSFLGKEAWYVGMSSRDVEEQRAHMIGSWLATRQNSLKHVLMRLELDDDGNMRSSAQAFLRLR